MPTTPANYPPRLLLELLPEIEKLKALSFEPTRPRSSHGHNQVATMSPPAPAPPGASSSRVSGKRKHTSAYHLFMNAVRADMNRKFGGADALVAHFNEHHANKVRKTPPGTFYPALGATLLVYSHDSNGEVCWSALPVCHPRPWYTRTIGV